MVNVIIVENLGNEFDLGNIEAGKIHLLTDGSIVILLLANLVLMLAH